MCYLSGYFFVGWNDLSVISLDWVIHPNHSSFCTDCDKMSSSCDYRMKKFLIQSWCRWLWWWGSKKKKKRQVFLSSPRVLLFRSTQFWIDYQHQLESVLFSPQDSALLSPLTVYPAWIELFLSSPHLQLFPYLKLQQEATKSSFGDQSLFFLQMIRREDIPFAYWCPFVFHAAWGTL